MTSNDTSTDFLAELIAASRDETAQAEADAERARLAAEREQAARETAEHMLALAPGYVLDRCPRCGGPGFIGAYAHIDHGRCFKCGGLGYVAVRES